jgi:hypothetical protein
LLTDHDITEELAAAFHDRADPVHATALDPAGIFRRGVRARRRQTAVRAAAVGAVAALAAVVLAVNLSPGPAGRALAERPPGLLLAAAAVRPPPVRAAVAGMPRYYVTVDHFRPVAKVRAAATGKVLSTVPLPRRIDPKQSQIAAAGDGRGFALALFSFPRTRFYWLRVSAGGRLARLTALNVAPLSAGDYADGIALSPNGSKLAVAIQRNGGQRGAVEVVSLATGTARTWTTGDRGYPAGVSWADNQRLGFFWDDVTSAPQRRSGLWALDTAAPGHDLLSGRRVLPEITGGDTVQDAELTTAGTVIASITYNGTAHVARGTVVGGIVELSAGTGRPLRTLLAEHAAYAADPVQPGWYIGSCLLAAADHTGSHLLVSCDRFGRLDRGRFTPLPGAAPQSAVAAAW